MIKYIVVLCLLTLAFLPAQAQGTGSNCHNCNSYAQCQQYQTTGGCGCVSGYDPVRHIYRCAWCGVCAAGNCIYGCNSQWFPGTTSATAEVKPQVVAPAPFWATNPTLSERISLQSPAMAEIFDFVKELRA